MTTPNTTRRLLAPLTGWVIEPAMALDEASPGFLRMAFKAKVAWRQSLAAAVAGGLILNDPAEFLRRAGQADEGQSWSELVRDVAELLPVMSPKEIIEAGLGECPDGFIGTLGKIGLTFLQEPRSYIDLFDLMSSNAGVEIQRRKMVEQMAMLDDEKLAVISTLDPLFLQPGTVSRVGSATQAEGLNRSLAVIRGMCSTATDTALRQSLAEVRADRFRGWERKWLGRADVSPAIDYPWSDEPGVTPVTLQNVRQIAQEWRNCLSGPSYAARLISGVWAAATVEPDGVVVTFRALEGGTWLLTGVYGRGNAPVAAGVKDAVLARFRAIEGCVVVALPADHLKPLMDGASPIFDFDLDLEDC